MSATTKGIVLSRESVGETDIRLEVLTADYGIIVAKAKAAKKSRRRYAGGLDLFCHIELALRGDPRGRPYLIELLVLNSMYALRENVDRCMAAGQAVQWTRKLLRDAGNVPESYKLLGQTLALFCRESDETRLAALGTAFRVKLLSQSGLMPKLDACVRCELIEPLADMLAVESGGVLCTDCFGHGMPGEAARLDATERRTLELLDKHPIGDWSAGMSALGRAPALNRLLGRFASYHGHLPVLP